jgi:hypothetical protein
MSRPVDEGEVAPPALSEEELAFRASLTRLVDWYRLRQSRALAGAFVPGLVLLPLGSLLVAASAAPLRMHASAQLVLTLGGVLVTAAGPLWAIWRLYRAIRGDLYVAIRLDGLGVRLDPKREEALYAWERVREVRHDAQTETLCIEIDNESPLLLRQVFEGISLGELGGRIRDARRLAVWNRLRPRYSSED